MPPSPSSLTPQTVVQLVLQHRWLLIAPAIAGAVLAAVSTFVVARDWRAEQGLLIRSDAAGYSNQRLGKFTDLSEMKTVQETLLELARSRRVVSEVLTQVDGKAPSPQKIDAFRKKLRFNPPGGAEFGKTEVFYLGVLDPSPRRAGTLVEALTEQLEKRMQELRNLRATSMVSEVERSVFLARQRLDLHTAALGKMEQSVGADLLELRFLTSPSGGQSELGQRVLAIESEKRQTAGQREQNIALLQELTTATKDPNRIVITPDALLTGQPGLRRLKNALIDAQLAVARLGGTRTEAHPFVRAARMVQEQVKREFALELPATIASVDLEIHVAERREATLAAKVEQLRERTSQLSLLRTDYAKLIANVDGQTSVLESAVQQLADAQSHLAGAASASLLERIDVAEISTGPMGPSRSTTTAAGGLAGLILGSVLLLGFFGPTETPPTVLPESPQTPQAAPVQTTGPLPTSPFGVPTLSPGGVVPVRETEFPNESITVGV